MQGSTEIQKQNPLPQPIRRGASFILFFSVFIVANCGLIYELLAGALSSYLLGNSITQFSLVIGLFLSAMGLGAFISRMCKRGLLQLFISVEIAVGVIGGTSALVLFTAFAILQTYELLLIAICLLVGTLVGLEIPLLVRILRNHSSLRTVLGNVLALDYLGALTASLLFPLLLVPHLGLIRTSFFFGLLNIIVALLGLYVFRREFTSSIALTITASIAALGMCMGLASAGKATTLLEDVLYDDTVIYSKTTPFQRLVITRWRDDIRLFIDGNIQFSSIDEHRYHESLVHPALGLLMAPKNVLLLGGGDGLAAREVLKHKDVERLDLVDLDAEMTHIFSTVPLLTRLNKNSLKDRRVHITNQDAQIFLEQNRRRYDAILIDLPDPNNESVGKLYTRSFYRLVVKNLNPDGIMVTQATSPYYATKSFWCIVNTLESVDLSSAGGRLSVLPYHAYVPSFGDWGFVLASLRPLEAKNIQLRVPTRFLSKKMLSTLFSFPPDIGPRKTAQNHLNNQILLRYYEEGYKRFNQ